MNEIRVHEICRSLRSVFIDILHGVPAFLESGLCLHYSYLSELRRMGARLYYIPLIEIQHHRPGWTALAVTLCPQISS